LLCSKGHGAKKNIKGEKRKKEERQVPIRKDIKEMEIEK
jgi:hypothetical protein